jgi:hypothetical protein
MKLSQLKLVFSFIFFMSLLQVGLYAQSDDITLGSKEYTILDRLDVLLQNDSILGFNTVKPLNRAVFTNRVEYIDSLDKAGKLPFVLSPVDRSNMRSFLMNNAGWTNSRQDSFPSRKPVLNSFYKTPGHLFSVRDRIFSMEVDPVLNLQLGHANDETGKIYTNTRGVLIRGSIDKKIGFYTYLSDNQEKDPLYVRDFVASHDAVPGVGFYKPYGKDGKAFDYFDFRGGISFNIAKYIHVQYAYDKLFIGNGFRSLFVSDFSNDFLFMRLNTRLWKLKYEMIIAETIQSVPQVARGAKPKNYMAIHHLSIQATKWLNLGFYENIMEKGSNRLQLSYLNPVIFYRATESNLGIAGKASIGLDLKANVAKKLQFYSQIFINEFHIHELLHYNDGSFANKQALQFGGKYINVLGVKNLDLQIEYNLIRPFTYTNFDSVTNNTHYNQPLAHPLGANVKELIMIARYQPIPKLYITGKIIAFKQGLDSAGVNMGGNIFRSYDSRTRDYGFFIGTGISVKSTTASLNISYELFENAFLDFNAAHRTYNVQWQPNSGTSFYSLGFRLNLQRREFNF